MEKIASPVKRFLQIRGMPSALTAFAGLIVIYLVFGLIDPVVFRSANVQNLLRGMSVYLLIGIGQSFVLITGNIDLSIGSVVGMSAMMSATLMSRGVPLLPSLLITLVCCLLVGVLNGLMVGKAKLPPFIATLGTMFMARGVAIMVNNNRNTGLISGETGIDSEVAMSFRNFFYFGQTFGIFNTFWIAMFIFGVFFFVLSKTRTGRHIYAIGSNMDAAKLSGVNVTATIIKVYVVSAFCAFVVGLVRVAMTGMGFMEAGNMYEMFAVAAAVIGGISPMGGTGILLGTLAGASVWQTLENGLNMVGAQVGIQRLLIGAIVPLAVLAGVAFRRDSGAKVLAKWFLPRSNT
ncbi:MAG: ABC transporter permease [Defluviitaleaceae bacterium]|nr:ABC transporter permease [Defluviitaleaceae bacterium]